MSEEEMNGDRGWVFVKDKLPPDSRIVLVGYCEEAACRLFLGCYFMSGWLIGDSRESPRPKQIPDIWLEIPQPPNIEKSVAVLYE